MTSKLLCLLAALALAGCSSVQAQRLGSAVNPPCGSSITSTHQDATFIPPETFQE